MSTAELAKLPQLLRINTSVVEMADLFGVHRNTIYRALSRIGVRRQWVKVRRKG